MTPDTSSGRDFAIKIRRIATDAGYCAESEVVYGNKSHGGARRLDAVIHQKTLLNTYAGERVVAVQIKWQNVSGSKDEQLFFELEDLEDMMSDNSYFTDAILMLGGDGFKSGIFPELKRRARDKEGIHVFCEEDFRNWL